MSSKKLKEGRSMNIRQKAENMIPQTTMVVCLNMFKTLNQTIKFIRNAIENWKL